MIRDIRPEEFAVLGRLLVDVYSTLEGFPSPTDQPRYYEMLTDVGALTRKPQTRVLVAESAPAELAGGVVYFGDMAHYGSGGLAPSIRGASGIRLLGVSARYRQMGVGRALTNACISLARQKGHSQVVLHTTAPMRAAWRLYEKLGFVRYADLDFLQQGLPVFGFRLDLSPALAIDPPIAAFAASA